MLETGERNRTGMPTKTARLISKWCVCAILCLIWSHQVSAKEEILWVKWALMPEYIESGPFKGTGYLDHFLKFVQARLPEYEHRSQFQTLNRISQSWAEGNVCSLHIWLGYWPEKIVYSKPYAFTPRFGVVSRKDSTFARRFNGRESLSLQFLLAETDYKLGLLPLYYLGSKDSRYPLMAPLIEPYLNTEKVHEFHNSRNEVTVAYLDKQRVDYMIRQRITQFAEIKTRSLEDHYQFHFLDEGKRHKLVASACSNSELGRQVITRINQMIDPDFHMKYLALRQQWDQNNEQFDTAFVDYFIKGVALDYVTE